ncbi:hypothetical protein R1flu_008207 [Riccia fluitans]|uniref:Uncharacterized protein n=1 Tax=Riccia fluitans TaxID=41844 RepID=A0ABD1YE55_9MARC
MALLWFCRYEEALGILEKDYPNGKEAVAYIKAIDPRKFSRYALVLPRYGRVTSNAVECMIAAFLKLREYAARRLLFEDEAHLISSQGPLTTISDQAAGPSTQDGRGKSQRRRVIVESKLEGPSSSQRVIDPDASTPIQRSVPIPPVLGGVDPTVLSRQLSELLEKVSAPSVPLQVLESQQKTCEDLTNRLMEAGGTIAGLATELKQKDCEVAALKERLQGSEQKLQQEEAKNAWLNEFTGTLTSELQTLRTEGTKAKLTGKVPDRDWLHEAKQRWRAHPTPENLFRLTEALEEHEDQILVREKMFLKHAKYLTITVEDEEAPPDISKAAVVLCRRNDVMYTSAERQEQLDRPFTNFPGWNCAVSSEGGTINVPEQFRGEQCALFVNS